jgi:hypothetical protein
MPLQKHSRNQDGTFHKERSDSLVKHLKLEYPEFSDINGNTKLGTLKEKFDTDSLDGVLRALRKSNN